jgi:hypothetical protein
MFAVAIAASDVAAWGYGQVYASVLMAIAPETGMTMYYPLPGA